MFMKMLSSLSAANFIGRFWSLNSPNGIACSASSATTTAIMPTNSGCASYPNATATVGRKQKMASRNTLHSAPITSIDIEKTFETLAFSLLANLKKVVSKPNVRITSSTAVHA